MYKRNWAGFIVLACFSVTFLACNSKTPNEQANKKNNVNQPVSGFPADSFAYYENALAKDTANMGLRMALATNYYSEKQYDKAILHLQKVYNSDKKNKDVVITLGNVYYDAGQYDKGIEFYEKALTIDPKNSNVRCDLATCYLNIKNTEKAFKLLKKNIEMDYNHAQSHHNLSVVYKQMGKIKESEEELVIFNKLNKQ